MLHGTCLGSTELLQYGGSTVPWKSVFSESQCCMVHVLEAQTYCNMGVQLSLGSQCLVKANVAWYMSWKQRLIAIWGYNCPLEGSVS